MVTQPRKSPSQTKSKTEVAKKTAKTEWEGQISTHLVWILVTSIVGSSLLFWLPAIYLTFQNFSLFNKVAFLVDPQVHEQLQREKFISIIFFTFGFLASIGVCVLVGKKVASYFTKPLKQIDRKMRLMIRGDWRNQNVQLDITQEIRPLQITFQYLYSSLRSQIEHDIRLLEKIPVDPSNKEAVGAIENLKQMKKFQLGEISFGTQPALPVTAPVSNLKSPESQRRQAS